MLLPLPMLPAVPLLLIFETTNVPPPIIVVLPVYVLLTPDKVNVPVPSFVNETVPAPSSIIPENVVLPVWVIVKFGDAPVVVVVIVPDPDRSPIRCDVPNKSKVSFTITALYSEGSDME